MMARPGDQCWQSGEYADRQIERVGERADTSNVMQSHMKNFIRQHSDINLEAARDMQPWDTSVMWLEWHSWKIIGAVN